MSNVLYIPQDIIEDIFLRLPVKSLLRFKCLSRSCCLMIDNPEFIKAHAKRAKPTESNLNLIVEGCYNGTSNKLFMTTEFNFREIPTTKNIQEISYPSSIDDKDNKYSLIGSCNGLVCLVYSQPKATIILWNPSTRKHTRLPICSNRLQYANCKNYSHGFGYDEVADDYKVVRLVRYSDEHNHTLSEFCIYSLKSNEWRSLDSFAAYGDDLCWWYNGLFVNGALHWLVKYEYVLAFNLTTEKFRVLPLPPETLTCLPTLYVTLMGGCQHLIFGYSHNGRYETWVMKFFGSWIKVTSMDLPIHRQLLIFRAISFAFFGNIYTYEFEEPYIQITRFPIALSYVNSSIYSESLVRLDAGGRS